MRVGLVCPYSLDVPGGVQNHVRDLAAVLRGRGHDVLVLAPGESRGDLPEYVETVGRAVPVRFNGSVARLAFGPRVAARVRRWVDDGAFDLLHVHEPVTPSVSLLAVLAADVPIVATFHSSVMRSRAMSSSAALLRPSLEKINARIAVSEAARATLVQHYGGEPVVIPNGVWCDAFGTAAPRADWRDPGPTLAFLGRLDEPRKGLGLLVAALPEILRAAPATRLLVAGSGRATVLEDLVPRARSRVLLLGQVDDVGRGALYASADCYVAPNTGGESFGITLVEAMSAGTPVVASDLPAFRAVLDDGSLGVLFAAGDPGALAAAAVSVITDRSARLGRAALAADRVRRYDWPRVVRDIEAVYDTVSATAPRTVGA